MGLYLRPAVRHQPVLRHHRRQLRQRPGGAGLVPTVGARRHARHHRHAQLHHPAPPLDQLAAGVGDERLSLPDPNFQPAPGQSLYDFLISPISPGIDAVTGFTATLDGVQLDDVLDYRHTSKNVFHFKGDPTMEQWDTCVTTHRQEAVQDGYYLMFKPLSPGAHQIVVHGQDMEGTQITLTENLTID